MSETRRNDEHRYAVLIDAENISPKYIKIIFDEISNHGITTYRRIYGDWTSTRSNGWKSVLLDHSVTPIQQYSYTEGKNASDSAMIIDAMDILYTHSVDGFCLVSSDSDFTRLASRLRESGMTVIGMGESKTPSAFISACNTFKYLDILYRDSAEEETETNESTSRFSKKESRQKEDGEKRNAERRNSIANPQPQTKLSSVRRAIRSIIQENSDEDNRMSLSNLGNALAKRFPDFDSRNYGHKKLTDLVDSLEDFAVDRIAISDDGKVKQVYIGLQ